MVSRRALGLTTLALAALALPATALALRLRAAARARPAKTTRIRGSRTSTGVPEIGALYANAQAAQHGCTASVIHSPHGNTLITAAHCVSGSGAGMVFVPGQHGNRAPYGRWTVSAAYVDPKWVTRQDPADDVAFLTVAPRSVNGVRTEIEHVTGGYGLGATARRNQRVTVTGYPAGTANDPITCTTRIYLTGAFPSFDCRGYVDGTSGSPWLRTTRQGEEVVGVIGGLNQGGCHDYTSYSSPLAHDAERAYVRASGEAPADVAPAPGDDGC
jgi:V8-like Glu-specific endopeptidase